MKTIKDIDIQNKTLIIRCDFNVPIKNGVIVDDARILKSLNTIKYALKQNAKIVLLSHLAKVKEKEDLKNTLKPVAEHLSKLLNQKIYFIENNENADLAKFIKQLEFNSIILLENTRFADLIGKRESNCDLKLAKFWADLGDIFIYDAFGSAHRNHASTGGIAQFLPTAIGFLMEEELLALNLLQNPEKPFMGIMGGAKIDDKILMINRLLTLVDKLLIGGGLAIPFLKALNYNLEYENKEHIILCKDLLMRYSNKIVLPIDVLIENNGMPKEVDLKQINKEKIIDIGSKTNYLFNENLQTANIIFWNGPMGIIEQEISARGTVNLLKDLSNVSAKVIIGGGDTGVMIKELNLEKAFYHVSTGGGATLNYVENGTLPVIEIIKKKEIQ